MAIPAIKKNIGINRDEACIIVGIAIWFRGAIEVFRSYYRKSGYPFWLVVVNVLLITLGAIMIHRPLFSNGQILWVFVILILCLAVLFFVIGFLAKPASKR